MTTANTQNATTNMPQKSEVHLIPLNEDQFVLVKVTHSDDGSGSISRCRKIDSSITIDVGEGTLHILPLDENRLLLLYADAENETRSRVGDENALFTVGEIEGIMVIENEDDEPILSSLERYLPQSRVASK